MNHFSHRLASPTNGGGTDVFFWGDEQEGSEGFRRDAWDAFREDWRRSDNPWAVGMGDYRDWLRPTVREHLEASLVRDRSARRQLDDLVRRGLEETAERLEFMKGRVLGLHEGHHEWEFLSGATSTALLAEALRTVNYGWVASTRISIVPPKERASGCGWTVTLVSTHGNAGGRNTTAVARSMEESLKDYVCDLKVMGHACRSDSWVPHEFRIVRRKGPPGVNRVVPRHLLVGGFCEAYTDGWRSYPRRSREGGRSRLVGGVPRSTYAERRNLTAQPLMWGVARLRFRADIARAREIGANATNKLLDVEAVNRGPVVRPDGSY